MRSRFQTPVKSTINLRLHSNIYCRGYSGAYKNAGLCSGRSVPENDRTFLSV
jgi:hypothetical protein